MDHRTKTGSPDRPAKLPDPPAGPREWLGLAVLALPTILLALDFTALHLALPHLSASLEPSGTQQLWILDIYGFMIAGFLMTMGTLGDRIGRRKLLLYGALAFGICSIAAAFSISAEMLIVSRALLGIAGATLMPSTLSLISNMFKQVKQRQFAIAVWLGCFSFGGAVGPLIGGMFLEWFWWGAVFLLGVPVMLLLVAAGPFLLPEYRDAAGGKLDFLSVFLSVAAMLAIIYGIKELSKSEIQEVNLLFIGIGAVLAFWFVRRQNRLKAPLVDLQLFKERAFAGALTGLLAAVMTLGAFVLFFAQYLQLVEGMTPFQAGLWMIPYAVSNIAGAAITPMLANRMKTPHVISGGLFVASLGFVLLFLVEPSAPAGLWTILISSVVITLGLSPLMVLGTEMAVASAPPAKSGSASSLSETCSELGMALGVALLGTAGAVVYRNRLDPDAVSRIPQDAADLVREHLSGAVAAAEAFPSSTQAALLASAREAFISGWQVAGGISALLLIGLAAVFLTVLRSARRAQ